MKEEATHWPVVLVILEKILGDWGVFFFFDIRLAAQIAVNPLRTNCLGCKSAMPGIGSSWLAAKDLALDTGRYSDKAVDARYVRMAEKS